MSPSVCHNFNTATCCNNNTCNNNNHSTIAPTIVLVDNSLDFSGITKQKKTKKNSTKHKRNKIACKGCRQAKKRCSHERPCSRCTKLGVECVDLETGKKRGRPPKKSLLKEDISSSNSDNASSTTNSFQPDNLIPNNSNNMPQLKSNHNSNIKKEVEYLNQVTRSFAVVIQELPEELKEPICIFYLVLRGLDTVEDDTEYLKDKTKEKDELLRTFHERIEDSNFHLDNCGSSLKACPHYEELMMKFHHVCRAYVTLDEI
ncbi:hypothetical protein ABK040_000131 [Willaertia magna]